MNTPATTGTRGAGARPGHADTTPRGMTFGTLGPFLAIAFGLCWGIGALLMLFTQQIEAHFGR